MSLGVNLELLQVGVNNLLTAVGALTSEQNNVSKVVRQTGGWDSAVVFLYIWLFQTYEGGWLGCLDRQSIGLYCGAGSCCVSLAMLALDL